MSSGNKFLFISILFFFFTWLFFKCLFPFLFPFLIGLGLALLAEPLTRQLSRCLRLPRGAAAGVGVCCTFLLFSAFLYLVAALIFLGLSTLGKILPNLTEAALSGLLLLEHWLLSLAGKSPQAIRPFLQKHILALFSDGTAFLDQGVKFILGLAGGVLTHIPDRAFTLFTGLVSGFMFSSKLPEFKKLLKDKLSLKKLQTILTFLRRLKVTVLQWLLAQMKLAGITLLILTLGLILLNIPYAPLWALAIALLDALPLLGTGIVLIPWSIISFLAADTPRALGLLAVYVTAMVTRSTLEPRFVGKQLGLDPLITLASIYCGYRLWGFGGMILSPLLAVAAFNLIPQAADSGKVD